MTPLDGAVVALYVAAMLALGAWLGRRHGSDEDYYVGGRALPWWAIGLSTMATQSSAVSFLGIPAYVALREGGGMTWLQYELAVPLAMIVVMAVLIPLFRELQLVSVYEYLERRFDRSVRLFVSGVFLISRGLATGVALYAAGIVVAACLGWPVWATVLLVGVVTVIYDVIGGMSAVVYSDVVQMVVLVVGLAGCLMIAVGDVGGWDAVLAAVPSDRMAALDPSNGLTDGGAAPFWGFLIGGIFLYVSYYGVDQSQVQRELSAPSEAHSRLSLLVNGVLRFPLTLAYATLGLALGALLAHDAALSEAVTEAGDPNFLVPLFVLQHLPEGFRALLVAAILAAAMSSLDSALNSLSAVTERDLAALRPDRVPRTERGRLRLARIVTMLWGAVIIGFALLFVVDGRAKSIVESINQVGSAFYGPILSAFLAGILVRRATGRAVIAGALAGVAANLGLGAIFESVFFMWWNLTGTVAALAVTLAWSLVAPARRTAPPHDELVLSWSEIRRREAPWIWAHVTMLAWFALTLGVILAIGVRSS